jgi:hypothetical protein
MNKEREALKLALEALEEADEIEFWNKQKQAITAIKEALAQPPTQVQEPVEHCEAGPERCPVCAKEPEQPEQTLQQRIDKAYANRKKAHAGWVKAHADWGKDCADWVKAYADWQKADAEVMRIRQLIKEKNT